MGRSSEYKSKSFSSHLGYLFKGIQVIKKVSEMDFRKHSMEKIFSSGAFAKPVPINSSGYVNMDESQFPLLFRQPARCCNLVHFNEISRLTGRESARRGTHCSPRAISLKMAARWVPLGNSPVDSSFTTASQADDDFD